MNSDMYISIKTFCKINRVDESFVQVLNEYDILTIEKQNKEAVVALEALPILEKMVRLHKELDINPEGLHAIHQLLKQIYTLEQEVELLQRKLRNLDFYR